MNIPIYRGKAKVIYNWSGYNKQSLVEDGQYIEGYYYKDVISNEDSDSLIYVDYIRIEYGDHYSDIEIDPSTLAIHFPDMIDKNGERIFAALNDISGIGGSEVSTIFMCGATRGVIVYDAGVHKFGVYSPNDDFATLDPKLDTVTGIYEGDKQ